MPIVTLARCGSVKIVNVQYKLAHKSHVNLKVDGIRPLEMDDHALPEFIVDSYHQK